MGVNAKFQTIVSGKKLTNASAYETATMEVSW